MVLSLTAQGFDQVQGHVAYLSGKVHAVPTRSAYKLSAKAFFFVGSANHKKTNAKTERVIGVLGDTLRAFNGRKDDWDSWLP